MPEVVRERFAKLAVLVLELGAPGTEDVDLLVKRCVGASFGDRREAAPAGAVLAELLDAGEQVGLTVEPRSGDADRKGATALTLTAVPEWSRLRIAATARRRASSCRRRAAAASGVTRSVGLLIGPCQVLETPDDLLQVAEHDPVVVGDGFASVGFGGVYELASLFCLAPVGGKELDRGVEARAGETRVRVWAVLLGGPSAKAVGEAGGDARQVVLDPLGIARGGVGFVGQVPAVDVDAGGAGLPRPTGHSKI